MKNFLDPSVRAKLIEDKVLKPLTTLQKATALAIYAQLIENTPVGNPDLWLYNTGTKDNPSYGHFLTYSIAEGYVGGAAKSNWWMTTGRPAVSIRKPDKEAIAGQAQAQAVMQRDIKIDQKVYISNNLPYISRLNDGWSTQTPAGFVENAIQVGNARGKEYVKRIK